MQFKKLKSYEIILQFKKLKKYGIILQFEKLKNYEIILQFKKLNCILKRHFNGQIKAVEQWKKKLLIDNDLQFNK